MNWCSSDRIPLTTMVPMRFGQWDTCMTARCAYCAGRLPLGVRFRNIWNGVAWIHVRFCSATCERRYEQKKRISNYQDRWLSFFVNGR